jgi:hypothetical protein
MQSKSLSHAVSLCLSSKAMRDQAQVDDVAVQVTAELSVSDRQHN